MAIWGSFFIFLLFAELSKVFIKITSPSISAHIGVMCGDPSFDKVDMKAKFLPWNRRCRSFLSSSVAPDGTFASSDISLSSAGGTVTISTEFIMSLSLCLAY